MSRPIAVLDACVLYPAPLRDLLMHLALVDLFSAKWTATIHEEWIRSVLADRPDLTRKQLERTRKLMDSHVLDCLVTGYESLIPGLALPDPDDRHVFAAAIVAKANIIVTYNLGDFPNSQLSEYEIEAQHPDDFVNQLIGSSPVRVCDAAKRQRASLKNPPKSVEQYLDALDRQALTKTVAFLRSHTDSI